MGRKSHDRAMGNGCSLALAMFSCYAMLWDVMLRYAMLARVVMNRLLSRGPLGIGSVRVCVCVCVRVCVWCVCAKHAPKSKVVGAKLNFLLPHV